MRSGTRQLQRGIAAALCLLAGSAHADGFSVSATVTGDVHQSLGISGPKDSFQQIDDANSFPDAAATQVADGSAGVLLGDSSAHATATFGALSAGADASCAEDPVAFPDASAGATAAAEVFDTLHVSSPTLAAGTPVAFYVDLHLTTNYTSPADAPFLHSTAFAKLDANGPHGALHLEFSNADPAAAVTSGFLDAQVGDTVILDERINAGSNVGSKADALGAQDGVTSQLQLALDGAQDVALTADSGHDYAQLVPEAAASPAGLAAIAALGAVARRAREKRPAR